MQVRLGRHYRLRWSQARHQWQIEHQVARAREVLGHDDATTRLRDGYVLVLETPATDWLPCPTCGRALTLPAFEREEITCGDCRVAGVKRAYCTVTAGFFPLCERTLNYLESWHPRQGNAILARMEASMVAAQRAQSRELASQAEALAADHWRAALGIPRVGYTRAGTPHSYGNWSL